MRGFEALCRWQHPVHGAIPPDVFIPVAESSGLIVELGSWILHEACRQAASWEWKVQVAVNVSPCQVEDPDLVHVVQSALRSSNLPPHLLELEVTESALLGNSSTVSDTLMSLRKLGVGLALDDFGAGWSSLATLKNFNFDRIKIDHTFISQIESDPRSVAIVRAVLSLAQSLNVPVTAEGIEDHAQLVALRKLGCSEVQGFYLGRPAPHATAPRAEPWLPETANAAGRIS
jgi:EAL domain-containing protein (putative c-di-GMP-specific phosphodiesterase class I)